jgi:hypothetical protein
MTHRPPSHNPFLVCLCAAALALLQLGCVPRDRLTFPYRPLKASAEPQWFDMDGDGRKDFSIAFDPAGQRVESLGYDDDHDGQPDRVYRLADYAPDRVPHLVILLDSIPYHLVEERYRDGEFRWFAPPQKVIPPFPSLTEICYTDVLHAPPLSGMIDQYYDRRNGKVHSGLAARLVGGYREPWERYLHYGAKFSEGGWAYLKPRDWYPAELERARAALDNSPDRTTIVYLTSASGMVCRYGRTGAEEVLDGMARLCLQLLWERQGAIKITVMADHGHNLIRSKNLDLVTPLEAAGFHVAKHIRTDDDVVLEISGLVTYAAVRTRQPEKAASTLLGIHGVQHAFYLRGDRVIARDDHGYAEIEMRAGRLRYAPVTRDVLDYAAVVESLRSAGKLDADGFASRDDWFAATVDDHYPDAPCRLWDAFHGKVVNPPEVMFTTYDGYCAGIKMLEGFIHMHSTHGSLNQINSTTFIMSMTGRVTGPLRSADVMPTIVPGYVGSVKAGN